MRQNHVIDGWYLWQRQLISATETVDICGRDCWYLTQRQWQVIFAIVMGDICDRDGWYLRQRLVIFATWMGDIWHSDRSYFYQWPVSDAEGVSPLHEPRPHQGHGQAHRQVRHTHLWSMKVRGNHLSRLLKGPPKIGPSLSLLTRSWTPTVTAKRYLEAQCYVIAHVKQLGTGYSG